LGLAHARFGLFNFLGGRSDGEGRTGSRWFPLSGHPHDQLLTTAGPRHAARAGSRGLFIDGDVGEKAGLNELGAKVGNLLRILHGTAQGEVAAPVHRKRVDAGARGGGFGQEKHRVKVGWLVLL
jgi:hypothetical protein